MSTPLRIGVIGTGRIGRLHAMNLAFRIEGASLAGVADIDADSAGACARQCGSCRVFDDVAALIDSRDIDAVAICSATNCHAEQIILAAATGKPIFCEKPIDLALDRIDAALAAVEKAGVPLQIGFNRRFDRGFAEARRAIAAGHIGIPHIVRITSRDPAPPPAEYIAVSGGLFCDMTIHDFDMARWIIGDEVQQVFTSANTLVDPAIARLGDVDTALVSLRYRGGALGSIDNSRKAVYGYDQRLEVFGSEGCIIVGNALENTLVQHDRHGSHGAPALHFFVERYEQAYLTEMRAFVECVRTGTTPPVTGIDGRVPLVMALAAERSRRTNAPVTID